MKLQRSHIARIEGCAACRRMETATLAEAGIFGLQTLRVLTAGRQTVGMSARTTHVTRTTTGTPVGVL